MAPTGEILAALDRGISWRARRDAAPAMGAPGAEKSLLDVDTSVW